MSRCFNKVSSSILCRFYECFLLNWEPFLSILLSIIHLIRIKMLILFILMTILIGLAIRFVIHGRKNSIFLKILTTVINNSKVMLISFMSCAAKVFELWVED
jgi:hypothetical protein